MQLIPLTEVNHRMKQIRQFTRSDGFDVPTNHDKPALIGGIALCGFRMADQATK
jgi:hypothetical protein